MPFPAFSQVASGISAGLTMASPVAARMCASPRLAGSILKPVSPHGSTASTFLKHRELQDQSTSRPVVTTRNRGFRARMLNR
jgi:hypothetical protein